MGLLISKNNKKLSIITICYNIENEIRQTCESIVNQTWQDFEWIIIDGGSTDGTLDVLEEYKNRIDIFISEKDEGIFDAMNKGILRASGEYLNFMNGGDAFSSNNSLQDVMVYIKNKDIYYGNAYDTWPNSERKKERIHQDYLPSDYFLNNYISHQASFIRRELFEEYGLYDKKVQGADRLKFIVFQKNACSFYYIDYFIANQQANGISWNPHYGKKSKQIRAGYFTASEKLASESLASKELEIQKDLEILKKIEAQIDSEILKKIEEQTDLLAMLLLQQQLQQQFSSIRYYKYKILRKLTWGKTRRRYKEKYKKLKEIKHTLCKELR